MAWRLGTGRVQEMTGVQKLIRGATIVSMDVDIGDGFVGDIHVDGDRIVAVGRDLTVTGADEIDARGQIVFPGLIDGHRHVWQSLLRGVAVDWTLGQYMAEARSVFCGCYDPDAAYLANYLGGLESISAGITSVVDHSHLQKNAATSDALAQGLLDSGVGGIFCYALQNVPDYTDGVPFEVETLRALLRRLPDDWHDANAMRVRDTFFSGIGPLKFGVALPEATPYLPPELACIVSERARKLGGAIVTGHWDANPHGSGASSLGVMRDADLLSSMLLAHCNHLGDADLAIMAEHRVGLCTCPDIEAGMGIGPLLARRFVEMGGAACLGIDLSSYVEADILKQARLILQLERHTLAIASGQMPKTIAWAARAAFELATIGGAHAIGMGAEIGSLTPGKRADIAIAAPSAIMAMPVGDPVATLLFYTNPGDIRTVLVAGDVKKRNGHLVGVDLDNLRIKTSAAAERILTRAASLSRENLNEVWAGMF
jgi:5-methylthioadenosine/S-adenosylhomocysteine deaminase